MAARTPRAGAQGAVRLLAACAPLLAAVACEPPPRAPSAELVLAEAELRWRLLSDVADWLTDSPGLARRTHEFVDGLRWDAEDQARRARARPGHLQILRRMEAAPGLYNYDNIYQIARIDDASRYLLFGKRSPKDAHTTFQVMDASPSALGRTTLLIDLDDVPVERGETFQMQLGGEAPVGDGSRWRALPEGSRYLLVRQTFSDWSSGPGIYVVSRSPSQDAERPAENAPDAEAVLRRFAAGRDQWAGRFLERMRALAINAMRPVAETPGGLKGQYTSAGRFALQADETLLVTLPEGAADYFSVQLGDEWFVTPRQPPKPATVTRNRNSSRQHSDGRYRYAVSAADPGVANWLAAGDIRNGFVLCRWQGPGSAALDTAAVEAVLLKTDAVADHLTGLGVDLDAFEPIEVSQRPPAMRHYPYRGR